MQSRSVAEFEPRGSGPLGGFTSGTFSGQMSVCHGVDTFTQKHWPGEVGLCQPEVPGVGPIETDNWDNILKLLLLLKMITWRCMQAEHYPINYSAVYILLFSINLILSI